MQRFAYAPIAPGTATVTFGHGLARCFRATFRGLESGAASSPMPCL